jgi:hypothetical protein
MPDWRSIIWIVPGVALAAIGATLLFGSSLGGDTSVYISNGSYFLSQNGVMISILKSVYLHDLLSMHFAFAALNANGTTMLLIASMNLEPRPSTVPGRN